MPVPSSTGSNVTPSDVLSLRAPASDFLCEKEANVYGIEFTAFEIRDASVPAVLRDPLIFKVSKTEPPQGAEVEQPSERLINYKFPKDFLRCRTVLTKLRFSVGPKEVHNFRMIERHFTPVGEGYKLIKSYDFAFNFCIPNSTNDWEASYDIPALTDREFESIRQAGAVSDSFYFVNDELIMHNRANYSYV